MADYTDLKRDALRTVCTLVPAALYFHKHRKVLLQSAYKVRSSYYDPGDAGLGYGNLHHAKELAARLALGFGVGWCASGYLYGFKQIKVEPEVTEILEDDTTLQYAAYAKQADRQKRGHVWFPGKIKD